MSRWTTGVGVPPGPPPLPDTARAEHVSVEEDALLDVTAEWRLELHRGAAAAERLQRMRDGISLYPSSLPCSPPDKGDAPDVRKLRSSQLAWRPPGAPSVATGRLHPALMDIGPSPRLGRRHAITADCTSLVPAARNGRDRPCLVCGQERHCLAWCASLLCGRMDTHRAAALRATREAGLTLGTQLDCLDQRMEHEAREEVERVARSRLAERPGLVFDRTATFNTVGYMLHGASSSASARTSPRGTPRTALASPRPARSFSSTSLPPMCPRSELQQRGPNRIPLRHLPLPEFPYSAQFSVPVDGAWRRREAPYE